MFLLPIQRKTPISQFNNAGFLSLVTHCSFIGLLTLRKFHYDLQTTKVIPGHVWIGALTSELAGLLYTSVFFLGIYFGTDSFLSLLFFPSSCKQLKRHIVSLSLSLSRRDESIIRLHLARICPNKSSSRQRNILHMHLCS